MNIFVAKLNFRTDDDQLRELFEQYGEVDSAKIILDRDTGRSRGFAFVEMPDEEAGQAAIAALNGTEFDGFEIVVKKAEPRENNRGGGGRGRGGYGGNRGGGGYGGNRGGGGYGGGGGGYDRRY